MNILQAIILGIVQGITEWLPISSSGHLVIFEHILSLKMTVEFDIFLHLASFLVLIVFFRKEILTVLKVMFKPAKFSASPRRNWGWYILLSTVITGILGWIFYQQIEVFRTLPSVAGWLIVTSLLLIATAFSKTKRALTWQIAGVLGLIQGLAVLPGLSRSGAVIALALVLGLKKKDAFEYTFLLAIPAIFGSFLISIKHFEWQWIYLLGFIVTFVIGYLGLILLKKILDKNYFHWFFVYTLAIALIIYILA